MIVTWSFALFLPAICAETAASGETKPYSVFKDTASPDGRYAVAWGLPKHPEVWAKVSEFERQHSAEQELNDEDQKHREEVFQSVDAVAEDVENYLVEVRDGKIIHKLDCPKTPDVNEPEMWVVAGMKPNRHGLDVLWSKSGNVVLVNHTFRWDCVSFCALLIRDGKVSSSLDLNKKLGAPVRAFAAKSFPRGSGYSKNLLNVCFSHVKQLSETKFSAHAETVQEKEWSAPGSLVSFSVIPSKAGPPLKVADIRVGKDKPDSGD